ncbi:serine/threonine-protein kinase [Thermogemmatispora sp.]|uniref:serine/threonine-protein kinase n=1 Tax=Thermogemmatispora sp. TaxID=1968838 RepID=UPI001DA6EC23|nr:serine/threonine-protein kinase [Thermogemmatispora sp.]MBX5449453.1 serine/threonine protein kinase [Thermogemmatispora sp.]
MLPDLSGQQIDHDHLLRLLGTGSLGQVYLAEDRRHSPPLQVALKLLSAFQLVPDDLYAFLNEARASLRLRHPHIVPLLDLGFDPQRFLPSLVMTCAPGSTLRQHYPRGARLPLATVLDYVAQLSSALHSAHNAGMIHRDLKPDNVLLNGEGRLLLSNFGIAHHTSTFATSFRSNTALQGTPVYMGPEQLQG